ncbi:hypothetical protein TCAL_00235 [Tigriopus californicus]|uniref:Probable deoxycytidylate deaminase n=1 Tax=Tigriopus californicus TaxID=6832 RepID=A0A553P3D6_TIGCA|nr:deoxycytidylate deaminase-like [Tigriopus californicus]TRY72189.1 hypothetical protein TCAL_00235 [Tigriopus californicus]|eukprot:TCALIF_00235-PA protein Name:"Similar to Dctd Deoxycytidylate deaminase (Rattus norvegicus)" AED:0.25 eAED:0.25 QI:0/-1/0/1/-1/1/1/0/197
MALNGRPTSPTTLNGSISHPSQGEARTDVLSWDSYFMATAFLSAMRSKDPVTQVGAVIVNRQKRIVGIGYNGMPRGCPDDQMPWGKGHEDPCENKFMYVCHAEMNAILSKNAADVENCTIYVALFPCNECAKIIIQAGVREVVYYSDKRNDDPATRGSKRMLSQAGVQFRQFIPPESQIVIDFHVIDHDSRSLTPAQ